MMFFLSWGIKHIHAGYVATISLRRIKMSVSVGIHVFVTLVCFGVFVITLVWMYKR